MENIEPSHAAYHVVVGGNIRAKSNPVTTALKSFMITGFFLIFKIIISVIAALIMQLAISINA